MCGACVTCAILISLCCRMNKDIKGWFTEMNDMWPGQTMAMQVDEILHHEKCVIYYTELH